MSRWKKDDIVEEIRANREQASRLEEKDPAKFHREARELAKKLGIRRSTLKPLSIDFSRLRKKGKGRG